MYIPKRRDFTKDQKEEILGNQGFRAREAFYVTPYPERVYGTCNRRVANVHQGLP